MTPARPAGRRPSAALGCEGLEDRTTPTAGLLDTTFGTQGTSLIPFQRNVTFNTGGIATAVATQPDGKTVLVGYADSLSANGASDFAVVRLNTDGTLDSTFGSGGRVYVPFDQSGSNNVDEANAVLLVGNQILVGGYAASANNGNEFALARLNSDGSLDPTFGGGGKVVLDFGDFFHDDHIYGMALQGGKIIAIGGGFATGFQVARFNANGVLDGSFGTGGKSSVTTGIGAFGQAASVAVQPDGKVVVVGDSGNNNGDVAAIRLTANGNLDTSFGSGGMFNAGFTGGSGKDATVRILSGGQIVIGATGKTASTDGTDFAVIQLTSAGQLDPSFGPGGIALVPIDLSATGGNDTGTGLVVQSDGKIVISGTAVRSGGATEFAAARLTPTGRLDPSFGVNGKNAYSLGGQSFIFSGVAAHDLAFGPNGTFLIAGTDSFEMAVIRVTGDQSTGGGGGGGGGGAVSGLANSLLALSTDGAQVAAYGVSNLGSYDTSQVVRVNLANVFPGFTGLVRTAVADVNGDLIPDFVVATGPGTPTQFAVINGADQTSFIIPPTYPFRGSQSFSGGAFVSAGDLEGNGQADIVISPDQGGGPRVVIYSFSGNQLRVKADFYGINDPNFRGGVETAIGDLNGDSVLDLAVAAGAGGGPRVAVYDGANLFTTRTKLVNDFYAFANILRNGINLTIGDLNGDGFGDLILGAGDGGSPRVLAVSGKALVQNGFTYAQQNPIANFFVNRDTTSRSGVRVTTKNVDGDGLADLIVGSGAGQASRTRVYLGSLIAGPEPGVFQDLDPFNGATLTDGVYVG